MLKIQLLPGVGVLMYGVFLFCLLRCPDTTAEKYDLRIASTTLQDFNNHTFRMNWTQAFPDWIIEFNITQTASVHITWKPLCHIFLHRNDKGKHGIVTEELPFAISVFVAAKYTFVIPEFNVRLPAEKCIHFDELCIELSAPAYLEDEYTLNDINPENDRECVEINAICQETVVDIETRLHTMTFDSIVPERKFRTKFDIEIANKSPYMLKVSILENANTTSQLRLTFIHKQHDELKMIPFRIIEPLSDIYIDSTTSKRLRGSADLTLSGKSTCQIGFSNEICIYIIPDNYSAITLNHRENSFLCVVVKVECPESGSKLPERISELSIGLIVVSILLLFALVLVIYRKKFKKPTTPVPKTGLTRQQLDRLIVNTQRNESDELRGTYRSQNSRPTYIHEDDEIYDYAEDLTTGQHIASPVKPELKFTKEHLWDGVDLEQVYFNSYNDDYNRPTLPDEFKFICGMVYVDIRKNTEIRKFRKPVTWTVPHTNANLSPIHQCEVWYSSTGQPATWSRIYGESHDYKENSNLEVKENYLKFSTERIGKFAFIQRKDKIERHICVFLNSKDFKQFERVYLRIYAVREKEMQDIEKMEIKKGAFLCIYAPVVYNTITSESSNLDINISDVQPSEAWKTLEDKTEILFSDVLTGNKESHTVLKFNKVPDTSCAEISGKIKITQSSNKDTREIFFEAGLEKSLRRRAISDKNTAQVEYGNQAVYSGVFGNNEYDEINEQEPSYAHYDDVCESGNEIEIEEVVADPNGSYCHHRMKGSKAQDIKREMYDMSGIYKGCAYILNNDEFDGSLARRYGSEKDFKNIVHLFEELGFQVERHKNMSAKEIQTSLTAFTNRFIENQKYKASVVVLMSHGYSSGICGTDGKVVKISQIQKMFDSNTCPQLKEKPKLFFIQACRIPVNVTTSVERDAPTEREQVFSQNGQQNADMHLAFATVDGCFSWRNERMGSWFINALVEVFFAKAHEENFAELMQMVRRRVGNQKGKMRTEGSKEVREVQMTTECRTTLKKALYFLPAGQH